MNKTKNASTVKNLEKKISDLEWESNERSKLLNATAEKNARLMALLKDQVTDHSGSKATAEIAWKKFKTENNI